MGCVASKLEEDEEAVSICRERKRQLKLAVERRYVLAESHCKYFQALLAVSASLKLFVARHSSPASPFLITFPPPSPPSPMVENVINNPMFLQQRPSESTHEALACEHCASSTDSESSEEEKEETVAREEQIPSGYFYMQMPPPMPSPQRDFGWDFFNPFDSVRAEVIGGYRRSSDDDLKVVREEEGIPELEEEVERKEQKVKPIETQKKDSPETENGVEMAKLAAEEEDQQRKHKGLTVFDRPVEGRELLEALEDVEDHFYRVYESGKEVSRMLEANRMQMLSGFEEIKENSTKLIQAITWHRSASSKPSSCKSLVASSSKGSSTWTEFKNDLFDDYAGMDSGSHSSTLGRLYAWEKKLFEEVKAVDSMRKIYQRKCLRLRNMDVRGDDELTLDKTRAAIKDLHARILVAIRSAESISEKIEKLRDEELHPQIIELIKGLSRTWKIMLESHEMQNKILIEVKTFSCPTFGKFHNNSHRLATIQLHAEIQNWQLCFTEYVSAQKGYIESLKGWLNKFMIPEVEYYARARSSTAPPPLILNGPPLLMICSDWFDLMEKLPDRSVGLSLRSFGNDVRALCDQQWRELQQRRRIDSLAKDLEGKIRAFEKTENRVCELMITEQKSESEIEEQDDYLTDKKDRLDRFRRKLEAEKEKHHSSMQETQRMALIGFQTGFSAVFESLSEFAKASQKMFNDLVIHSENLEKVGSLPYIENGGKG